MSHEEDVMFARSAAGNDKTELRGLAPTPMVQALDAFAYADGMNRNDYVNRVLAEHVEKESHKTMLRVRMLKGNPLFTESTGTSSEAAS